MQWGVGRVGVLRSGPRSQHSSTPPPRRAAPDGDAAGPPAGDAHSPPARRRVPGDGRALYIPGVMTAFLKMHGLGNDFVVLDARQIPLPITAARAAAIADRRRGVGCDQLITLESPGGTGADV